MRPCAQKTAALLILLSISALAPRAEAAGAASRKKFGIAYQVGAAVGSETLQNSALSVRKQTNWNLNGMLGIRFRRIALGGFVEYRSHSQTTDPDTLGGTNASGKSLLYGPAARIEIGSRIFLSAAYLMAGSYDLEAATASNEAVTYLSPKGYRGQISLRLKKKLFLDLAYTLTKYNSSEVGAVIYDLASDPIQATIMDFGFSLAF